MRASLRDPFVDDRAVASDPLHSVEEGLRRGRQVIQQPDGAKIRHLRDMESEQIVLQRRRRKIQELDLIAHRDGRARIIELLPGQPRLPEQRVESDARTLRSRIGEPAHRAMRARQPFGAAGTRWRFAWHWLVSRHRKPGTNGQVFGR